MGRMCVRASVADSVALADVIDVVAVQRPPPPADATPERWTQTRSTRRAGQGLSVRLLLSGQICWNGVWIHKQKQKSRQSLSSLQIQTKNINRRTRKQFYKQTRSVRLTWLNYFRIQSKFQDPQGAKTTRNHDRRNLQGETG